MTINNLIFYVHRLEDDNICLKIKNQDEATENCDDNKYTPYDTMEIIDHTQLKSIGTVKSLSVSHCKLSYLPDELQFSNLTKLDISNNHLEHIPDLVINNVENLYELNVSYNKITNFNILPKCHKKLKKLYLHGNYIREIPQWIFYSSCISLEILDLSNNPLDIDKLCVMSGSYLKSLNSLTMNNSNIKKYCKFFQEIPNLKKLSISNNSCNEFLNTIHEVPFKSFNSTTTLTELHLSRLGYGYISEEICELDALELLNLSWNHISWLPNNFINLKFLKTLDLSYNELLCLPVNIDELENLTNLYLSHNLLGSLPENLQNLNNLKLLDCYYNDLLEDTLLVINKMSALVAFDIEQNLFHMKENEQYLMMRSKIRHNIYNRVEGYRYVHDSENYLTTEEDSEDESSVKNEHYIRNSEEENWDFDENIIDDDAMLVLPPYQFKVVQKPVPYNPSDYIHPMYFEDSLDDDT